MIVRRPAVEERDVLEQAEVDLDAGLLGDSWSERPSRSTADGKAHPEKQITLMNARAAALIAGERERWPLAGDQLYVDLALGYATLPPGSLLSIGDVVIEVTEPPHTGCAKFTKRFGVAALKFVNSEAGRELNLRGINARVDTPGTIRVGDTIVVSLPL
jgi:MOSC domain-containing protein YiiM